MKRQVPKLVYTEEWQGWVKINSGDVLVTKCRNNTIKHYLLIDNVDDQKEIIGEYLLIDLEFYNIREVITNDMSTEFAVIEHTLEEEIIDIVSINKLLRLNN